MKWEYKTYVSESITPDEILQEFGEKGWKLVSVLYRQGAMYPYSFYFKRPITDK